MIICQTVQNTLSEMVKNNYSPYLKLLDEGWKNFQSAHPNSNPAYCLVSEDVENFLDAEQIAFLCPVIIDKEMEPKTMCLVYATI